MNIRRHFSPAAFACAATATVAVLGAVAMFGASGSQAEAATSVVQLERVVIVGKRQAEAQELAVVHQLPRVVVTGRRSAEAEDGTRLASLSFKPRAL
jgi:hypothetical protein